jgi:hypothetical protein
MNDLEETTDKIRDWITVLLSKGASLNTILAALDTNLDMLKAERRWQWLNARSEVEIEKRERERICD